MAGSLKYFIYTTDTNVEFGILMDEDWGEVVGNADLPATAAASLYGMPKNLKPRKAVYRNTTGTRTFQIAVTDPAATTLTLPAAIVIDSTTGEESEEVGDNILNLYSLIGERFRAIIGLDTGLIDGDLE